MRKPTTFGISFGLTTITLAWITGQLQVSDRTRWLLLGPLAVADTTEVAWVAVQRWRGVASHFNFATTLDTALFLAGAAAITVTVTIIVAVTVLSFWRPRAAPSMVVAVRAGLLVLAWLLSFAALSEQRRLGLVWAATTGYGALVAVSLGQTAAGLAPLDLGVAAAVLSLLGMVLLGTAFTAALLALRQPTPASA